MALVQIPTRPSLNYRVEPTGHISSSPVPTASSLRTRPSFTKLDPVRDSKTPGATVAAATSAAAPHSRSKPLASSELRIRGTARPGTTAKRPLEATAGNRGSVARGVGGTGDGGAAAVNVMDRGNGGSKAQAEQDGFIWSDSEEGEGRGDGSGNSAMPGSQSAAATLSPLWRVLSVVNDSTKWVATAATAAAVLATHNRAAAWFVIGAVLNAANGKALKRVLRHERPETARGKKADPGMPSSHALSLAYLSVYGAAAGLQCYGVTLLTSAAASLLVSLAAFLAILRVLLGLHTPAQVAVGWVMGTVMALLWHRASSSLPQLPLLAQHAAWVDAGVAAGGVVMFALFVLVEVRKWLGKAGGRVVRRGGGKEGVTG